MKKMTDVDWMFTLNAMSVALDKIIYKGIEIFQIMHSMC